MKTILFGMEEEGRERRGRRGGREEEEREGRGREKEDQGKRRDLSMAAVLNR